MNVAVIAGLERERIPYELLPHPRTTTAAAEAHALDLPEDVVAKTLVMRAAAGYVRALLPASHRLDPRKLAAALDAAEIELVPEDELVGAYPEFELGAVPPVGGPPDRIVLDRRLEEFPSIVFEAGRHDQSVRVRTSDLIAATHAVVADICLD